MLQQAVALHQNGRLTEAAVLYRKILAGDPDNGDALHFLGVLEFQGNNALAGLDLIERAVGLQPSNALLFFNRGNVMKSLNRVDAALESYDRALSIKPDYTAALYNRGAVLQSLNRFDEALAAYDRVLVQNPASAEAHNIRGVVLTALKRPDEALSSYEHAINLKPDFVEALVNRGNLLQNLRRFEEAVASYDRALVARPDHVPALNNRGNALQDLRRFDEALASYDRALALKPDHVHAMLNSGLALHALRRFDEELLAYERALAIQPDNAEALNRRGDALRSLKRYDEAIESLDKALAIDPSLENAKANREVTLLEMGRHSRLPPEVARSLFDDASDRYDETMLVKLGYRAHLHLRALAERVLPGLQPPCRILDLGLGTGLVGDAFKDLAVGGRLDGIDIAPRMLEAARARGIYDDLILGDLETQLAEPGPSYDLILAADTMIYMGDLGPTFAGVAKRLVPAAFFLFTCESKDGAEWELTAAHRFRHSLSYLRAEAERAGLDWVDVMECQLRSELGQPVPGYAVALKKPV